MDGGCVDRLHAAAVAYAERGLDGVARWLVDRWAPQRRDACFGRTGVGARAHRPATDVGDSSSVRHVARARRPNIDPCGTDGPWADHCPGFCRRSRWLDLSAFRNAVRDVWAAASRHGTWCGAHDCLIPDAAVSRT